MITRSKLVQILREYQIRPQFKDLPLGFFSPKPDIVTWVDVAVAVFWALLFCMIGVAYYAALHRRRFWLCFFLWCLDAVLLMCLRISRQSLAKKRDRRLSVPF